MLVLKKPLKFIWDKGNKDKNWLKHKVKNTECEEIFFDSNKKIIKDPFHSQNEPRYIILGKTKKQKILFIAFTIRHQKIRIISAGDINKKEKKLYEKSS